MLRLAVVGVYVESDNGGSALHGSLRYHWVGARMVVFVRYRGLGSGWVAPEFLGRGIVFAASVWQTITRFLVTGA